MFQRASELDPNFADAWAGLATAHVHFWVATTKPHLEKARQASARALKLNPQSAEVHVAAGLGSSMEQRYAEAAAEFERAIELEPTLFDAYYYYARACFKKRRSPEITWPVSAGTIGDGARRLPRYLFGGPGVICGSEVRDRASRDWPTSVRGGSQHLAR